jgi:hypothetical protein
MAPDAEPILDVLRALRPWKAAFPAGVEIVSAGICGTLRIFILFYKSLKGVKT